MSKLVQKLHPVN